MKSLFLCLGVLGALSLSTFAHAAPFGLQKLKLQRDFEGGCGCSVWTGNAENNTLVWSELADKAPAVVKVDGQRRELKFVSSTEKPGNARLGDRFRRVYASNQLRLTLDYVTTFVCGAQDEGCEVTRYRVNSLLEKQGARSQLRNLKGDCGC